MDMDRFVKVRPYLYHLTDRSNLDRIRKEKALCCTRELMSRAGRMDLLRTRRKEHERIEIDGSVVTLRDQKPLLSGAIELTGGFTFEKFVKSLNSRIFFWPGDDGGPVRSGQRHFARYASENPAMLRCRFQSLISANPSAEPLFCPYNSGAPRAVNGRKSPRGPDTFLRDYEFPKMVSRVVEVTFAGTVALPSDSEYRSGLHERWNALF
jgi:hypothetical protein